MTLTRHEVSVVVVWSSWALTALVVLVAGAVTYLGIGIAVTIVGANEDAEAVAGALTYFAAALAFPLALGRRERRREAANWEDTIREAAGGSLLVHLLLSPVALAFFAM
ncbi:MAG: hypothetical protein H0U41_10965 [Actinobacteria bacterium]|nr:hypothetical protein [Actinomycetota bacterium]